MRHVSVNLYTICLLNMLHKLCRVNPLNKQIMLESKDLEIIIKWVVFKLILEYP